MDKTRPFWQTVLLHGVLVGSSIVFALPFVWLVGTSWKLDKEIQTEDIDIFPQAPVPRHASPYIDDRAYAMERPEDVGRHRWDEWMRRALDEEIGRVVADWRDPRAAELPDDDVRRTLVDGVFDRLRGVLAPDAWLAEESSFRQAVRAALRPAMVADAFESAYRYFALGKVLLKDQQYRIHDLTGRTPVGAASDRDRAPVGAISDRDLPWRVERGPARIEPRHESGRPVAVVHYDFAGHDERSFEVSALLDLPVPFTQFKRLDVSFRRDATWHELRALIEADGRLYKSTAPKYLSEDTWWDAQFQLPSIDDQRLIPKHYVLLDEIDRGPQYDHGPAKLRMRVQLSRSSVPEAYWAKGTENYRKVFAEVPFWQYLRTSVFLAIVNIIGTVLSCSLVAYALARLEWPGRELSFVLVLATLMIPPQVTMIPSFVIYKYLGWYNTLAPLWVPSCLAVNAFAVFLLRQAMKGIPRELEDAAKIDGCGYLRTWWHVAMPAMRPTLAAISIFTFMYVWNDFMTPLIYVNDQRLYPLALGLFSFMAGRENQFTLIMAGAMVMTLPVIATFFLAQRYFIQGVTLTGLKG